MKLAFFGSSHAFSYHNIGGTDSFLRRLGSALQQGYGWKVDFVTYGQVKNIEQEVHGPQLHSLRYPTLFNALDRLEQYDQILTVYLPPRDRLIYIWFRRHLSNSIRFHMLFQSWPDSPIKRWLMFLDARLLPFNGVHFAVSPRLEASARRLGLCAKLLLPPVPLSYFVAPGNKPIGSPLRVTFLGRVDRGKGVNEVIELFHRLSKFPDLYLSFVGTHWPHDPHAVALNNKLLQQNTFPYRQVEFRDHSPEVEQMVARVLRETDIFLQPYRNLSSTIDTPLLLLEAMASLTAVITTQHRRTNEIYGRSDCLLDSHASVDEAADLILSAYEWLPSERERIVHRLSELQFDTPTVVDNYVAAVES